jgi:hypothetical protein
MGQSKKNIDISEMFEWLASTGYLFPSNNLELARFEKLYADFDFKLTEDCVDPFAIVNGDYKPQKIEFEFDVNNATTEDIRMAARNFNNIPEHIFKKIKRNQDGQGSEEKRSKD